MLSLIIKKISATQLTHNTRMVIREVTQLKQPVLVMSYNLPIAIISPYKGTDTLTVKTAVKKKRPSLNKLEKFFY